jgi:hypothetical protein
MTARGLASGLASQLASQLAGSGGGGGVSYDADAADYFSRAEALGGSFDLTAISGTYTESYVKTAISDYVAGCKTDGIWTKLTEIYLLSGVTFDGLMAKLKHAGTAAMTNTNFVTGDYAAAGSGAGLIGNGSTKMLDSGFNCSLLNENNSAWSLYSRSLANTGNGGPLGAIVSTASFDPRFGSHCPFTDRRIYSDQYNSGTGRVSSAALLTTDIVGLITASRVSSSSHVIYRNGGSIASNASSGGSLPNLTFRIFNVHETTIGFASYRASFASVGQGLTSGDAAALSTRTNALMTALGANVY